MDKIFVSIVGGSGYTGGELLRVLLFHPYIKISQVTSERFTGKLVTSKHPNLRGLTNLRFTKIDELRNVDLFFLCLPHKQATKKIDFFLSLAKKIIDLSADFRLQTSEQYKQYYGIDHPHPDLLTKFIYGIPELHREKMKKALFVSSAGCNATTSILSLYPLVKENILETKKVIIEVKVGSSEGGNKINDSSHHPERKGAVRSYKPTGHRHGAEINQELNFNNEIEFYLSVTSIDMVRGVLATCHVFLEENLEEKDIWKIFRKYYENEPFIRIIKQREGNYRFPEPKILMGTNFCDIGFEKENHSNRFVVIGAIDNLMKGAAGQAIQACNIMYGYPENSGLTFPGLNPI